jgi:hypothetical protein
MMNAKQVYNIITTNPQSLDSLVCIITRLGAGYPKNRGSIPGSGKGFISFQKSLDDL